MRDDLPGRPSSIAAAVNQIGEKWALLVVREIVFGNKRFAAIALSTGGAGVAAPKGASTLEAAWGPRTPPLQRAPAAVRVRTERKQLYPIATFAGFNTRLVTLLVGAARAIRAQSAGLGGPWEVMVTAEPALSEGDQQLAILATVSNPGPGPVLLGFAFEGASGLPG